MICGYALTYSYLHMVYTKVLQHYMQTTGQHLLPLGKNLGTQGLSWEEIFCYKPFCTFGTLYYVNTLPFKNEF